MADQATRRRIGQDTIQFLDRIPRIQRHDNDAEAAARVDQFEILGSIRKQDGQSISGPKAELMQGRRNTLNAMVELQKSKPFSPNRKSNTVRIVARRAAN